MISFGKIHVSKVEAFQLCFERSPCISLVYLHFFFFIYHILYFAILSNLEKQETVKPKIKLSLSIFFPLWNKSFQNQRILFMECVFSICKWDKVIKRAITVCHGLEQKIEKNFLFPLSRTFSPPSGRNDCQRPFCLLLSHSEKEESYKGLALYILESDILNL